MTVTQHIDGRGLLRSPSGAILAAFPTVSEAWLECGDMCREFDRLVKFMPTTQLERALAGEAR